MRQQLSATLSEQPEQNKARYRYVSHLALNVSQVMKRAREEAGIYFE